MDILGVEAESLEALMDSIEEDVDGLSVSEVLHMAGSSCLRRSLSSEELETNPHVFEFVILLEGAERVPRY